MIIINNKFIFLRTLRISLESIYLIFASSLIFNLDKYDTTFFLLLISFSFHWIHIIASIFMLGNCYKKLNTAFISNLQLKLWLDSFKMNTVKYYTFISYSVSNIIISIYLLSIDRLSHYDFFPLSLVILIIFISSFVKILAIFFVGLLILIYRIRENYRHPTIIIEFNPIIERRVEPNEDKCGICLEDRDLEWGALKCGHRFHYECVYPWMKNHNSCPMCREPS